MKKEKNLKIEKITSYDDVINIYDRKAINSAICAGCWSISSIISASHISNSNYKLMDGITLGLFICVALLNYHELIKNNKMKKYYQDEKLKSEQAKETEKVLKKEYNI